MYHWKVSRDFEVMVLQVKILAVVHGKRGECVQNVLHRTGNFFGVCSKLTIALVITDF